MNRRHLVSFWFRILPVLLIGALCPVASADVRPNAIEVGGFGGLYLMEGNQELSDSPSYGGRIGYFFTRDLELEFTFAYTPSDYLIPKPGTSPFGVLDGEDVDIFHYRMETLYHFPTVGQGGVPCLVPYFALGGGIAHLDGPTIDNKVDAEVQYGVGMKLFITDSLAFRLDARHVLLFDKWIRNAVDSNGNWVKRGSKHYNNLELTLGVSYLFGGGAADSDGDGVPDDQDACPNTPVGCRVDARGCPIDSDQDGVWDGIDQCAGTPKGAWVDAKGCPRDSDGDGVLDGLDMCPDTPAGVTVNEDGCPLDSDKDRVLDGVDQCPNTPVGTAVDAKGCPADADGDGVANSADKCPGTLRGEKVDAAGCSFMQRSGVLEGINFELNSAKIETMSYPVLDEAARALKNSPRTVVEIGGHTDSTGKAALNQTLSQKRADAVRNYLVSRGVAASQITIKGYGAAYPIASNEAAEGRAKNRRIEFKIVSQ